MENIKVNQKNPGLLEYYFLDVFFKHYADFSGKISRKQYWMAYLFYALSMILLYALDMLIGFPVLSAIYVLITFVPSLAFNVRRLHDIGKSGWWYLIGLVPLIGVIWLLVLLCKKGETETVPVKGKIADWALLIIVVVVSAVGFIIGFKGLAKDTNDLAGTEEIPVARDDDGSEEKTEKLQQSGVTLLGFSTSGKYRYYLKEGELNLYQMDIDTDEVYKINMENAFDDYIISGISDYTVFGNKLVFISNNGAAGMGNADFAFYFDMDDETWHEVYFAKTIAFNEDKTALLTSSPVDESFEHFEELTIRLSDL